MDTNLSSTTTTQLNGSSLEYQTPSSTIDEASEGKGETYWNNDYWNEGLGLWDDNPSYKEPIRALARWTCGKGYKTNSRTKVLLDNITGWGEDSFQSILTNLIIVKKTNGDAFAEIIRNDKGTLINLKVLNPSNVRIVVNPSNRIMRYDIKDNKGTWKPFNPEKILHLCNDRISSQIHGTPAWKACKWELEAKKEVMSDWRRISHRSTIRILYIDADDTTKLAEIREQYKEAIKNGEVLIIPAKPGEADLKDQQLPAIDAFIRWIEYLDRRIYQSLGIPKAIADTADFTEAASKVGYMTFEPVYTEEQTLLEQDLWNQLAIKVEFNRPPSLSGVLQEDEAKNTGQVGFQPNELKATAQRTE